MQNIFEKFTIFGSEFKFRLIDFGLSTNKNISINNENFKTFANFLKRFETKFNEIQQNSILTKDVFSINFNSLSENDAMFDVNESLTVKRITNNNFVLFFNNFKDLRGSLIQFQNADTNSDNLVKLDFNYRIERSITDGIFDRLMIEFDSEDVKNVNLLIV